VSTEPEGSSPWTAAWALGLPRVPQARLSSLSALRSMRPSWWSLSQRGFFHPVSGPEDNEFPPLLLARLAREMPTQEAILLFRLVAICCEQER
jgi:hypothetical protein